MLCVQLGLQAGPRGRATQGPVRGRFAHPGPRGRPTHIPTHLFHGVTSSGDEAPSLLGTQALTRTVAMGTIGRRTSRARPSGTCVTLPPRGGARGRCQAGAWTWRCWGEAGGAGGPHLWIRGLSPGPLLRSLFISNYKAAPGFVVSHHHVSKWLFSVRPIRKLTHHTVTAANFFPLHVRWIAR